MKILIIFGVYLLCCYLFIFFKDLFRFLKVKKGFKYTVYYCEKELGHVFSVSGDIGSGKTTGTAGLITCLEYILMNKINEMTNKSFLNLYDLDFNVLEQIIEQAYVDGINKYQLLEMLLESLDQDEARGSILDKETVKTLLFNFIEAKYRLFDANFVMSNFPFKSNLTGSISKAFKVDYLNLNNIYSGIDINYPVPNYLIVAIDEANTDSNKKSTNFMSYSKEDTGFSTALRLARNMHKGTFYLIYVMQNAERLVKEEREIFVNNLNMQGLEIVTYFKFVEVVLDLFNFMNNLFEKIVALFHFRKKEMYMKKPNLFRKVRYKLSLLASKLFTKSYVVYTVRNYKDVDDIGKENNDNNIYYESFDFVFPITYVFGTVDTFYYKFVQEYLEMNSKLQFKELKDMIESSLLHEVDQQELLKDLLSKKESNNKNKFDF